MKFSIKFVNKNGCRFGLLSGIKSNPDRIYETPMSLITTKTGSVPHLTKDVFDSNFNEDSLLCIPVQHFANCLDVLQAYKNSISEFISLQTHPVCVVVQDPTTKTIGGFNDSLSVSTFCSVGRVKLTPEKYMELISAMRPDWYETLNDADTNAVTSKKRVEKSIRNSFKFFEQCREIHQSSQELKDVGLFAPLLGGCDPVNRRNWTKQILSAEVDGYCLLGLHENGPTAQTLQVQNLKECVMASLENVPRDKVRHAQGAYSILSILEMIECGVDIFDSSLAYLATEKGRAFCFPLNFQSIYTDSVAVTQTNGIDSPKDADFSDQSDKRNKKIKMDISQDNLDSITDNGETSNTPFEINLNDKKYMSSKEPILKGCKCYTCLTFTKSYVHHLLSSREMLASVLLMIHNLHHWEEFFTTIRKSILEKKFNELKINLENLEVNKFYSNS